MNKIFLGKYLISVTLMFSIALASASQTLNTNVKSGQVKRIQSVVDEVSEPPAEEVAAISETTEEQVLEAEIEASEDVMSDSQTPGVASEEEGGDEQGGDEESGDEQSGDQQGGDEEGGDEEGGDEEGGDEEMAAPSPSDVTRVRRDSDDENVEAASALPSTKRTERNSRPVAPTPAIVDSREVPDDSESTGDAGPFAKEVPSADAKVAPVGDRVIPAPDDTDNATLRANREQLKTIGMPAEAIEILVRTFNLGEDTIDTHQIEMQEFINKNERMDLIFPKVKPNIEELLIESRTSTDAEPAREGEEEETEA